MSGLAQSEAALYLTEADVAALVTLNEAVDALEAGMAREGKGEAFNIPKALGTFNRTGSLHALGSAFPGEGLGGFKTWMNTGTRGVAIMEVFDLKEGRVAAIIEASVLGQLRTAAMTGLGTRRLAPPEADELALIGTGRQAMMQLAAIATVRRLRRVRVYSPTLEKRRAFVEEARKAFGFAVDEAASLEAATAGAPIVTLVTRATEPFLPAALLAQGSHLNAVGAILPRNAEFKQDVFDRASLVSVDSIEAARVNSAEFVTRYGRSPEGWRGVVPLGEVIGKDLQRPKDADITLFKAMGMGISDLSVAELAIRRARESGRGRPIPAPERAKPRWTALA